MASITKDIYIPGTNRKINLKTKRLSSQTPIILNQRYRCIWGNDRGKIFTIADATHKKVWLREKIKPIDAELFKLFYEIVE